MRTAEFKAEQIPEQTDLMETWAGVHCPTSHRKYKSSLNILKNKSAVDNNIVLVFSYL